MAPRKTIVIPAVREPMTIEAMQVAPRPLRKKVIVVMSGAKRMSPPATLTAPSDVDMEETNQVHAQPQVEDQAERDADTYGENAADAEIESVSAASILDSAESNTDTDQGIDEDSPSESEDAPNVSAKASRGTKAASGGANIVSIRPMAAENYPTLAPEDAAHIQDGFDVAGGVFERFPLPQPGPITSHLNWVPLPRTGSWDKLVSGNQNPSLRPPTHPASIEGLNWYLELAEKEFKLIPVHNESGERIHTVAWNSAKPERVSYFVGTSKRNMSLKNALVNVKFVNAASAPPIPGAPVPDAPSGDGAPGEQNSADVPTPHGDQSSPETVAETQPSPEAASARTPEAVAVNVPEAVAVIAPETVAVNTEKKAHTEPEVIDRTPPAVKAMKAAATAAENPAAPAVAMPAAKTAVKVIAKPAAKAAAVEADTDAPSAEPDLIGFADLGLSEQVLKAISDLGFEAPTAIQAGAIPPLLAGRDLIGQAQTGTGKTAAFALPLVQMVDAKQNHIQAIILEPTRELAIQVADGIHKFAKYAGLSVVPVYGGQPLDRQFRALRAGAHIVVGTPGRVLDHLRRGSIALDKVRFCVLDEADEMLALGFLDEVETILAELPEERQTAFFSATMAPRVMALTQRFLNNPQRVKIESKRRTVDTTRQTYYEVPVGRKLEALGRVLDMETPGPTIVFCRTRQQCNELAESLRVRGYLAEPLHGEMGQPERDRVMKRFREGLADMLIATDVAARGLDIETVTHVINYELPWDIEQYIHRIGRTGRAGRSGDAITLVEGRERRQLQAIEKMIGTSIKPVRIPSAADITARRRESLAESLRETLTAGTFDGHLATVESLTSEFDASEIAAAALHMLWQSKHNAPADTAEELAADSEQPEAGMVRLFVSLGRQDNLRPGDLVGAITNEAGLTGRQIGAIDIMDRTSFVEVPANFVPKVLAALASTTLRGKSVNAGVAHPDENPRGNNRSAPGGNRGGFGGGSRGPGGGGGERYNKYSKR